MLEDKIKDVFSEMVVLKNPKRTEFFSSLSLPSYMRDWLVMKFSDRNGNIDSDSVLQYFKQYIQSREDFEQIKYKMVNGEIVRFLARIRVSVNIKNGKTEFELPDFGGTRSGSNGEVENDIAQKWQDVLLHENENWGILELRWERDYSIKQSKGTIKLINYMPFCPYTVDLNFYREARKRFTTQEWIDVLITARGFVILRGGRRELGRSKNDHIESSGFIAKLSQDLKYIAFEKLCFLKLQIVKFNILTRKSQCFR